MEKKTCVPVIKWVGGKRQLLAELKTRMPKEYGTYFEPFFGGGALFFDVQPEKAVVNDFNPQLINLYHQIKAHPAELMETLKNLQTQYNALTLEGKMAYYYAQRNAYNEHIKNKTTGVDAAALLIFLNKAGFNGLYRVNASGAYNVPFGKHNLLNLYDPDNFISVAKALQKADILCGDFEDACASAKTGDFVFFDSPYYGTFDTYQSNGFGEDSHRRLAYLYKNLTERGVYCMLTNSNTEFIKELYSDFTVDIVDVKRLVNCDRNNRVGQEVIVTNYERA